MPARSLINAELELEDAAPRSIEQRPKPQHQCQAYSRWTIRGTDVLDALVRRANKGTVLGIRYRPYWIMSDAAAISALVLAWAFSKRFAGISGLGLIAGVLGALLIYKGVLEVKAVLGRSTARSFLQDCLLIIIPSYLGINFLLKQPIDLTFAYLGILLPLYGSFARVGCFLGGCCFGRPAAHGVLYPDFIFAKRDHGCRRFSPSPNPGTRVFPIQLVEAAAQAALAATLGTLLWSVPSRAGRIFWLYLSLYAVVRFLLDFYRVTSARPRYWGFSEAQVVCVLVGTVGSVVLAWQKIA